MRWWGFLVLVASCYRAPSPEVPCAITCTDECPDGLTCERGYCVAPGQVCRPTFAAVSAGAGFACGLDEDGALWCWGSNTRHQIDPGDRLQYLVATRVEGRAWDVIDAGGEHVCGISAGELYCWGRNDHYQVAPISGDIAAPIAIAPADAPSRWTAVSAGESATCAIGDGRLYCWGNNQFGVLGAGVLDADLGEPTPVKTTLADWTAVDMGSNHACAVSASAGVHCWGAAANGRLGPNATGSMQPVPVLALAPPASAVAVSENASCAVAGGGALLCWGSNADGELGPSNAAPESAMPQPASAVTGWTAVTAAEDKLCGLAGDTVYCWGSARMGGLGNGVWTDQKRFGKVLADARAVSLGWNRDIDLSGTDRKELELGCAVASGDVQCWGDNRYGQLGRGAATMAPEPVAVVGDHRWTQLAVGASHACGIEGGALYCWGSTTSGQTIGMITGASSPRTPCMANLDCDVGAPKASSLVTDVTGVAAGAAHTCALHGELISCWGDNGAGQLGTGAAGPFVRDVPQPAGRAWASLLQTGRAGQCASPGGTEVWCWGQAIAQHLPMREAALDGIRAIGVGEGMTCVLDAAGLLKCAGSNDRGQFGTGKPPGICGDGACTNGETAASCALDCGAGPLTPTPRRYDALGVSATRAFACGLRGGLVECWGANGRGQTGAIDPGTNQLIDPTYAPSPVIGLSGCSAVAAGDQHACAICDGRIRCWGDGSVGALGAGPLTRDPVPVPRTIERVLDGDPWIELYAGQRFSCARSESGRAYCWGSEPHAALGNGATGANLPVTVLAVPVR